MGIIISRKIANENIKNIFYSFHYSLNSIIDSGIENTIERDYFWQQALGLDEAWQKKDFEESVRNLDSNGFRCFYKYVGEFASKYKIGNWKEFNEYEPVIIEELNDELVKQNNVEDKLELIDSFSIEELKNDNFLFEKKLKILNDVLENWRVSDNEQRKINKLLKSFNKNDQLAFIEKLNSDQNILDRLINKISKNRKDQMVTLIGDMLIESGFTENKQIIILGNEKNDKINAIYANGKIYIEVFVIQGRRERVKKCVDVKPFDVIEINYNGILKTIPAIILLNNIGNKEEIYTRNNINDRNAIDNNIADLKYSDAIQQYAILKENVASLSGNEKGSFAKKLRENKSMLKLNELFSEYPTFMNVDLRDFLNCKEDGTENYNYYNLKQSNTNWKEYSSKLSACHQTSHLISNVTNEIELPLYNSKFVNEDGREAVFDSNHEIILSYPDKGTYNYQNPDTFLLSLNSLNHNKYDINPYYIYMQDLAYDEREQKIKDRLFEEYDNITIMDLLVTDLCDKILSDGKNYKYKSLPDQIKGMPQWKKLSKDEQDAFNTLFDKLKKNSDKMTNSEAWEIINEFKKNFNNNFNIATSNNGD